MIAYWLDGIVLLGGAGACLLLAADGVRSLAARRADHRFRAEHARLVAARR